MVITISGQSIFFLLDTGTTYLFLMEFWGLTSPSCFSIVEAGGQPYQPHQTQLLNRIFRGIPLSHSFLVVPTCPVPLHGRDLLAKVETSISFVPPNSPDPRLTSSPSLPPPVHELYSGPTLL